MFNLVRNNQSFYVQNNFGVNSVSSNCIQNPIKASDKTNQIEQLEVNYFLSSLDKKEGLSNYLTQMNDNFQNVDKKEYSLKAVNKNLVNKGCAIINKVNKQLQSLYKEINSLLNNKDLTQEDIDAKIKLIEAKEQAIIKEAETKLSIMLDISTMLTELRPIFCSDEFEENEKNELLVCLKELANSLSTSISNYKDTSSVDEINNQNKEQVKEIFGKNSTSKIDEQIQKTEEKIEKIKEKLKENDLPENDKAKNKTKLSIFENQLILFRNYKQKISQ